MSDCLVPRSSEWLENIAHDLSEALFTAPMVLKVGHACNMCGEQPAANYVLTDPALAADEASTVRLCDRCVVIRRISGEILKLARPA